jgi:hypothetical protein
MIAVNQDDDSTSYILSLIHFDVCFVLNRFQNQVKEQQKKVLLVRCDRKLFDTDELIKYLSEVLIQNTFVLKDIINKALKIIDINNVAFLELEESELRKWEKDPISTNTEFECITIINREVSYAINTKAVFDEFRLLENTKPFLSQDLAHKSARLIEIITAAYPKLKTELTDKATAPGSFELLNNVNTTDCYNTLVNHNFIKTGTAKDDFKKIFEGGNILNKVDWIGTMQELSRFIYFLHTNTDENVAVCKDIKWHIVTCKCFTHLGKEIKVKVIRNNNRELKPVARRKHLLNAVKHLDSPKPLHKKLI